MNRFFCALVLMLSLVIPLGVGAELDGGGGGEVDGGGGGGGALLGSDLSAGAVSPTSATVGVAGTFSAVVTNYGDTSTGASYTTLFQRATSAAGSGATDIGTYSTGVTIAGESKNVTLLYTFTSAATWYVRVCADKSSAASSGTIVEYDESNNCGAWTAVVVSAVAAPTATLTASATAVSSGQAVTLTWSSTNATSCTGTNFSTGNQVSGTATVNPTTSTTYTVTCTGTGGTGSNSVVVTVSASSTNTTSYSGKLCTGGTSVGTIADTINTCVSYCTGLTASCCSTVHAYDDYGSESYTCTAYTDTQSTVTSNNTTNCSNVGGEPVCSYSDKTATLINYGPAVTASLAANPTSVSAGQPALLTWASTNATSCTGTNFDTGNATLGTVSITPTTTKTYTVTCTGTGGTAIATTSIAVNVFTVTCSPSPSPVTVLQPVSWTSAVTGGSGSYTYVWSGDDSLSGSGSSVSKTYTSLGEKVGILSVSSDGSTITTACTGQPCQQSSCTCTGLGCGVIVQEGVSADVTASEPTISAGSIFAPGGTMSFDGGIMNIGNNSISKVFRNRFQVDIDANGSYDVTLDTGGNEGSLLNLEYGKTCTAGSIVNTGVAEVYGSGALTNTITSLCTELSTSGQCCAATVTTGDSGGGGEGGGGGGGGTNLVQKSRTLASVYKSLALNDYYTIGVTVYASPTTGTCSSGTCYAGTWQTIEGTLYDIPFGSWFGVTSPDLTNVPSGTHKVRMCADSPTSNLTEANENNNCGPDLTFTISGFDLVGEASGIHTGALIAAQPLTFFGGISNTPGSYTASSQCSATLVVAQGDACIIAVNQDMLQWSTQGATIVNEIGPLTNSPTIPSSGSNSTVYVTYSGGQVFSNTALKADMLANGGVNMTETNFAGASFSSDIPTVNRICVDLTGRADAIASTYPARGFNSCGNNRHYTFNGSTWSKVGACSPNSHIYDGLTCRYAGSPYPLSGTHVFTTPLSVGTHTYRLTSNAPAPNSSCEATITITSEPVGQCQLRLDPSIIFPNTAPSDSTLSWILNNVQSLSCNQGLGVVTSNSNPSCLGAGEEVPAGGICTAAGFSTVPWTGCCSGVAHSICFAPDEPSQSVCWGGGAGQENEITVAPTNTTTYTCTASSNQEPFNFSGSAPTQFQIDLGNNGTWDTTLTGPTLTALGVSVSTQVVSSAWTAVAGTHAARVCANTPSGATEAVTSNNCGPSFVFTVANPTQCEDGIDNNGNNLTDTADPACTSDADTTEEVHNEAGLTLTADRGTVQKGSTVVLTWNASEVVADSCILTATPGTSVSLTGSSGTHTSGVLVGETLFTLSCTSMQTGGPVEVRTSVKLAPYFEEL